jgi:hypothetical protein
MIRCADDWHPVPRATAVRLFKFCARCHRWFDWRAAPLVGYQQDDRQRLELRNCPCGSTGAVLVAEYVPEE